MKLRLIALIATSLLVAGCRLPQDIVLKDAGTTGTTPPTTFGPRVNPPSVDSVHPPVIPPATCAPAPPKSVLVDASHDGGVWWFPQYGTFVQDQPHQGQALADYLRSRGYSVTELGRGDAISATLLRSFTVVVRAGKYGPYSDDDIQAYRDFAACGRTLLLLSEFLRDGQHDELAEAFGIPLAGWVSGQVQIAGHAITAGQTPFLYIAGSVLSGPADTGIVVLGRVAIPDSLGALTDLRPVMGVLERAPLKIFFIGDLNGIENVPQPLVNNLIAWGF